MSYESAYDNAGKTPRKRRLPPFDELLPKILSVVFGIAIAFLIYRDVGLSRLLDQQAAQLAALKHRNEAVELRVDAGEEQNKTAHEVLRSEFLADEERLATTQRDADQARRLGEDLRKRQKLAAAQIGNVDKQVTVLRKESGEKLAALDSNISATNKNLEETRVQLTSAVGDISNAHTLIARNHGELLELKRRGERNYFEFDLPKQDQMHRVADVSLRLKKVDTKHQRFTMEVQSDDVKTEKKDRSVNEPVQFYKGSSRALYEVVVNHVDKNHVAGYLATPK